MKKSTEVTGEARVTIDAPNFKIAEFHIIGTSPLVLHRFSVKARQQMKEAQESGSQAKSRKNRTPKNFDSLYKEAMYVSEEGWLGIPADAFRKAAVAACRLTSLKMTHARLSVFVEAEGIDKFDGRPLVRIIKGEPQPHETYVRLETGVTDVRVRPMWRRWESKLRVRWDADQLSLQDVSNLFMRVGMQVGIGEGRHSSTKSSGMGWGCFSLKEGGK